MRADAEGLMPANATVSIPEHDPLSSLLISRASPVALEGLTLESAALQALRAAGVALVVPLVADGRLLGTINLGPRRSDQEYTTDDRNLLTTLAFQLAPAVQLATLVRRQETLAAERERIDHELQVARVIQQTLLPRDLPDLHGWEVETFYRPAREVGGDFYDVIPLADGRVVLIEGDVTDKGVPAALVMATCRAALRAAAEHTSDPGEILRRTNAALVEDIPANMFVTCYCGVFEREGGTVRFANAGHPLPVLVDGCDGVALRASGMPLGMLPGSTYDVVEVTLAVGAALVVASDGVAEAHAPDGSMFGFERVRRTVSGVPNPVGAVIQEVDTFTNGRQEDDITVVVLRRKAAALPIAPMLTFQVPSGEGAERVAMERVQEFVEAAGMAVPKVRRLGTAVAEAVMNAAEHGNAFDPEKSVEVRVRDLGHAITVEVIDDGSWERSVIIAPDIQAKVAGEQAPRGWGRFLISKLADGVDDAEIGGRHVLTIHMRKEES